LNIVGANKQKMALTYGDDQVVGTRRQTGAATIDNSDMMFVGYGINAPERYWNDYAGANHYRTNYYRTITGHPSTSKPLPDIHQQASHRNHYRTSINKQAITRHPSTNKPLPDIHQQTTAPVAVYSYRTITGHPSTNDRSSSRLLILVDWMIEAYGKSHYQTSINNHYRTSIKNQPLPQPLPR
jgi:hypothetical protein